MTNKPATRARRGFFFELSRTLILAIYRLAGWRVEGDMPPHRKLVIIAAPHTSNWDMPIMLAVAMYYRVSLKWMGKKSLFEGPFGWTMHITGGIPIDRSKSSNVVSQMIEKYNQAEDLHVAIPPEGTRAKVRYWKTGFYNIAHGADVPIALGFLDYDRKVGGIGGTLKTTGDYDADLEKIKQFYAQIGAKHETRTDEAAAK